MREFLLRGKRTDNGEWITDSETYIRDGDGIWLSDENLNVVTVIPETVGQYTGLTDKKGKKIFEGDIFKFADEVWSSFYTSCGTEYDSCAVKNYGVVGFDEDNARFDFVKYKFYENSVEADLHENHDIVFSEFVSELEVIGNIHDSPELLNLDREDCEE